MNKYNTYITIENQLLPLVREIILISKQCNCDKVTILIDCENQSDEVDVEINELSKEYEMNIECSNVKTSGIHFGVYNENERIEFVDIRSMIKFLVSNNIVEEQEPKMRCIHSSSLPKQKKKRKVQQIFDNRQQNKNSVKYKQYARKRK